VASLFLEKEKKKFKTHGYDDLKEKNLTLSKRERERERERERKGKWRKKNMHHAFMLSCIWGFLHPGLNITLSTNHKHASTYHKKKIHIRNIITFVIIVLCHAFWIFQRVSFVFYESKPSSFIWVVVESFFFKKKYEKIVIYLMLIIMVLLCESRFPHLAKVPTPCLHVSQGFHTLPSFLHLVSIWIKVPTPCQGSHTLFPCESRFPHLVSMWVKVSTPCQGFYTLVLCESRFSNLAKVPTPCF